MGIGRRCLPWLPVPSTPTSAFRRCAASAAALAGPLPPWRPAPKLLPRELWHPPRSCAGQRLGRRRPRANRPGDDPRGHAVTLCPCVCPPLALAAARRRQHGVPPASVGQSLCTFASGLGPTLPRDRHPSLIGKTVHPDGWRRTRLGMAHLACSPGVSLQGTVCAARRDHAEPGGAAARETGLRLACRLPRCRPGSAWGAHASTPTVCAGCEIPSESSRR